MKTSSYTREKYHTYSTYTLKSNGCWCVHVREKENRRSKSKNFCRMSQFTWCRRRKYFEKIEGKLLLQIVENGKLQAETFEYFVMNVDMSSEGIVK